MVTSRCRTQPRTHISSLIAGHYSDRLLGLPILLLQNFYVSRVA